MHSSFIFQKIVPMVKRIIGIKDLALWRKRWSVRLGKIFYHKKYFVKDLIEVMIKLGMKRGSVVCIHSSMMQFYNYKGTAQEIISEILKVIGPEGTLMMPAFPKMPGDGYDKYVFDLKNAPTAAGYLAEQFRKYPGVKRSANVHHSVCAIGKYADYLIENHTDGANCWDETSPWYRLCVLGGIVFNLGLPASYMGTFHHCVEGVLYKEHPYWAQFFDHDQIYSFYDTNGNIKSYVNREGTLVRKTRKRKVYKHFTDRHRRTLYLSNLRVTAIYTKFALEKLIELGRKGISVYYVPSTSKYVFNRQ